MVDIEKLKPKDILQNTRNYKYYQLEKATRREVKPIKLGELQALELETKEVNLEAADMFLLTELNANKEASKFSAQFLVTREMLLDDYNISG